jgi:cellulose biosynthesis protein BcsQ
MSDQGGLVTSVLELFDPKIRPFVELTIAGLIIAAGVAAALNPILELSYRLWRFVRWLFRRARHKILALIGGKPPAPPPPVPTRTIPEERTIWELRAPSQPTFPNTEGIPIITVANMKGGVGKTTIVANLAVYFQKKLNKPVLLIDFDYQGSLSQTVRGEAGYTDPDLTADILISPPNPAIDPPLYAREMRRGLENVFLYPTNYPFATIENNLMSSWLQDGNDDLMYRLCSLLKGSAYQEKYGVVLIDCPPRLTTGSINALCASTHLLVPTTLDDMSAQAAEYFLSQVSRMNTTVFPRLKVIGVVPSIVYGQGDTLIGERRTRDRLTAYGKSFWRRDDFVLSAGVIPRTADISNFAGSGVACLRRAKAQQIFERLGEEVWKRL